jgi:hypothetical protein
MTNQSITDNPLLDFSGLPRFAEVKTTGRHGSPELGQFHAAAG